MNFILILYSLFGLLTLFALLNSFAMDLYQKQFVKESFVVLILTAFIFIILFGFRESNVGTDTMNYTIMYKGFEGTDFGSDLLVAFLITVLNKVTPEPTLFFVIMAILFIVPISISLIKVADLYRSNRFLVFFSFISFFFFYSLGTNVIRQAVALAFLMLGLINYNLKPGEKFNWIGPLILSIAFHITSAIPIILFFNIIWLKRINLWFFYILYFAIILVARLNLGILQFEGVISELLMGNKRLSYLTNESIVYDVGFKAKFVVFNTLFLIVFSFIYKAFESTKFYRFMLIYFILTSCLFFLTFQIPYSDRWGLFSWVTIPFMLSPIFSLRYSHRIATFGVLFLVFIFVIFQIYN